MASGRLRDNRAYGRGAYPRAGGTGASAQSSDLLIDAVDRGASVGFLPPLLPEPKRWTYWRSVIAADARGKPRAPGGVGRDGAIQGSVQLALEMRANGDHRAEAMKLFVHRTCPPTRLGQGFDGGGGSRPRAGWGEALLTMDTRKGGEAEKDVRIAGLRAIR